MVSSSHGPHPFLLSATTGSLLATEAMHKHGLECSVLHQLAMYLNPSAVACAGACLDAQLAASACSVQA